MKVEVKEPSEEKELTFPCLMKSIDIIVLFYSKECGIVVDSNNKNYNVGYFDDEWNMGAFEPFNGTITLSND